MDALTFILVVLYCMHLETAYLPISFTEKSLALLLLQGLGIVYAESFSGLIWLIRRSKYMSRQQNTYPPWWEVGRADPTTCTVSPLGAPDIGWPWMIVGARTSVEGQH